MSKTWNPIEHYEDLWTRVRNPAAGKPLANNTRLFRPAEDCFTIRLHATDIVTLFADGRVVLDTGGWYTMTTKERMTGFAPVQISSVGGTWYVTHSKARIRAQRKALRDMGIDLSTVRRLADGGYYPEFWDNPGGDEGRALMKEFYKREREGSTVPYFDGIMFDRNGHCLNGISPARWQQFLREKEAMRKRIQSYCTKFNRALTEPMPAPSGGDCWFCALHTDEGETMGDMSGGEHLLSHMDEDYFVPSLVWNALKAKGYTDMGVALHLHYDYENQTIGGPRHRVKDGSMGGNLIRRALRDYLSDRLFPQPPGPNEDVRQPLREVKGVCNF